jgi:hypothetical protein
LADAGPDHWLVETAARRGLNAELLARWSEHLQRVKNNPRDPFRVWAKVREATAFEDARKKLIEENHKEHRRAAEALAHVKTIVDYGYVQPGEWMVDGTMFGAGPAAAGTVVLGDRPEAPIRQISSYAAVRRDPLWNGLRLRPETQPEPGRSGAWVRAGRTFRTPTFTIESENVYYLVRGSAHVYAVVDSHRVNNGPLHGSLIHGFQNVGWPQWISQPIGRYRGHRCHLEFSARGEDPLDVLMVVQGDRPPGDPFEAPNGLVAAALQNAKSLVELASNYQRIFQAALKNLSNNELVQSAKAADEAVLAQWLWEHPELTVETPALVEPLRKIAEEFVSERRRIAAQIKEVSDTAPAMCDGDPVDEFLLIRGNARTPGDPVPRRFLEALAGAEPLKCGQGSGRLELARHIASPENPLTARVMVNRIWHHLLGRGIVASVDNFGVLGERPTHPELLDYLTAQFIDEGWSIKRLIRFIVLSRTYQMASTANASADAADPANLLLHKMRIRRLEGEAIRDALLAVSGSLDRTLYGPSVPVHLTPFMQGRGRPAQSGPLDGAGRRSIYGAVRRNFLSPMMLAFDTPAPFNTVGRRNVSNVPAQALILMNDPFVVQQARRWAERELAEAKPMPEEHVRQLYLAAFARPPRAEETAAAMDFLHQQSRELGLGEESSNDVRIWADLCHVMINAKEFIFVQ